MTRAWWMVTGFGILGVALLAIVALRWSPAVPEDAASDPLARAELTGSIPPDAKEGQDLAEIPRSPAGQECLPRVERSSGYMDVCWEAHRQPADIDPDKDYYLLTVYSTFGPGPSGAPRWAMLKADLEGSPADGVMTSWPDGEFDATCEPVPVALDLVEPERQETLCGHITAVDVDSWGRAVTWTCRGCLLPDDRDRALSLYVAVGVEAGTIPAWTISADLGG